jgi:phospholipid transport system substrate-binding protein
VATEVSPRVSELDVKNSLLQIMLLSVLMLFSHLAAAQEPLEQVEQAIAELATGLDGRKEELANDQTALCELINSILLPRFDRKYSAQLVLGKNWRNASADQRERFIDGFYDSLLRKYSEGVLEFDQERVQVLPFRGDLNDKRTIVKTIVRLDDGTKVTVNYGFANRNDGWKMFDVTIEGISYIRNYRAELASEISAGSLDAVIDRLEEEAGRSAKTSDVVAGE